MDFRTHLQQQLTQDDPAYWSLRQFADAYLTEAYGEGHLLLACYAAFPILLSPELLYKIWLNFRQYDRTTVPPAEIQWVAVSDLLVSGLVEEAGPEVFEMDAKVRDVLLSYLEQREGGMDTLTQLAEFLLYYSTNTLFSRPVFPENILEAQRWNALAFLRPGDAIQELKEQLHLAVDRQDQLEQARLGKILERLDQRMNRLPADTFGNPARAFRALLTYNQGMRAFFRGQADEAVRRLEQLPHFRLGQEASATAVKGRALPLPRIVYEQLRREEPAEQAAEAPPPGEVYALFIGINQYSVISPLSGAVADATELAGWLAGHVAEDRLHLTLLRDAEATLAAVLNHLRQLLRDAQPNDLVLLYFGGHGLNRERGSDRNALIFFDYSDERRNEGILYDEEFRKLVEAEATNDPSIVLILDTHAGSDRWLDPGRNHHLILSGCADEETSFEADGRGVFSRHLQQVLEEAGAYITYRQLMQEIRRRIGDQYRQYPQLFGTETGANRLFLSTQDDPLPRLIELLRAAGYYNGATISAPATQEAVAAALQRFRNEWDLKSDENPQEALQQKLLADQRENLQVLIVGGYQRDALNNALGHLFQELPYPARAEYYRLEDPMAQNVQKYQSNSFVGSLEKPASPIDQAQCIVLLIDAFFLRMEESAGLVRRIRQRRQTDYLPVVPLLVEECNWASHPVADLQMIALYRSKGPSASPEWAPNEGMLRLRDTLDPIGRFLRAPGEAAYLEQCQRFRDDMPFEAMETLRHDLQKSAAGLPNLGFLVRTLDPDAPQWRIFGAACALLEHPEPTHFDPVVAYLEGIQDDGPLHNVRLNVVYQLAAALELMVEADNRRPSPVIDPPSREGAIATLFALNEQPRVFRDKTKAGRGSISFKIFQAVLRLSERLPGQAADYFFRGGQVAVPLEFGILTPEELGASLPPQRVITFLALCEEFDGDMSVRNMDELGRRLKKHIARLETVDWMAARLHSGLFQGYVLGIAYMVQEKPEVRWLPVLTNYLRDIARLPDLGNLRLRVLYRLLMAAEKLVDTDKQAPSPQIDPEARSTLIDILEQIARSERARRDTEQTGGKGIGGRIDQLIRKLGLPIGEQRAQERVIRERMEKARDSGVLNLEALGLREIPEYLLDLPEVETLFLKNNQLSRLPGWLGKLSRLRVLDLSKNQLTDIRPLTALPQLEIVDLFENRISDLTPLRALTRLTKTNLSTNQIKDVSPLAALTGLKGLDLDSNQIEDITPLLALSAPEWVDLRFNQIRELPADLLKWNIPLKWENDYKEGVILEGNPIENVPEEILRQGKEAVSDFLNHPASKATIRPDQLREALFRLPFREQLQQAEQEVDTGARIIPIVAPVPPAAGPGLLRDLLCRQFDLPPEWLISLPLSEIAAYGWSERQLLQAILDGLDLRVRISSLEFDEFLDSLTQQDRHREVVFSLEDPGEIPEHLLADFLHEWLAFCDRLARKLGEQSGRPGLQKAWFIVLVDRLPSHFSADEFGGWISPVVLPEAGPVAKEEWINWLEREKLVAYRERFEKTVFSEDRPHYAISLIKRICQELGLQEEIYETYFGDYEVDEENENDFIVAT